MENLGINWGAVIAALITAFGGIMLFGIKYLRDLVKNTDNKWDDAILQAFDDGWASARKSEETRKTEALQKAGSISIPPALPFE